MTRIPTPTLLLLGLAVAVAGCAKDDEAEAKGETKNETTNETKRKTGPDEQPVTGTDDEATPGPATEGSIKVLARHADPKPTDPVEVKFPAFEVVSAEFDPKNPVGGSAEIDIDLSKLETGSAKRDKHLRSEDYLNVAKFGVAKVLVSDVKKGERDGVYDATAKVALHGVEVSFPVTFEVVETLPDGIRVEATHAFTRKDFGVGANEGDSVAQELELQLELVLKSS